MAVAAEVSAKMQGTPQHPPHRPRGAECLAVGIFSALPGRQQQPSQTRMVERLKGGEGGGVMLKNVEALALVRTMSTHPAARTASGCPPWLQGIAGEGERTGRPGRCNPWSPRGRTPPAQADFHAREIRDFFRQAIRRQGRGLADS